MTDWISYTNNIIQNLEDATISQDDINYADQLVQHILSNCDSINSQYNSLFNSSNKSIDNYQIIPSNNDASSLLVETSIQNNTENDITSFISVEDERNKLSMLNSSDIKNTHNESCLSVSPIQSTKKSNKNPIDITINIDSFDDSPNPHENKRYLSIKPLSVGSLLFSQHIPDIITSEENLEKIHSFEKSKDSIILLYKPIHIDSMIQTLFDYSISYLSESQLPTLIICPASVIDKVSKVFENNNQSLKIYMHRGKSKKSWISPQYIENYNIILTTYHYLGIQECLPLSEEELKKRRNNKCMIQKPIIQKNTTPVSCLHLVLWNRVIIIDGDSLLHKEKKKFNCVNQLYTNHMIFICKSETNDNELLQLITSKSNEKISRLKDYLITF